MKKVDKKTDDNIYVVKTGDNLGQIAKKYKTTVDDLMKLNKDIKDKNQIKVGQKIRYKV